MDSFFSIGENKQCDAALSSWTAALQNICQTDAGPEDFRSTADFYRVGLTIVAQVEASPQRLKRDRILAAKSRFDHILLCLLKGGQASQRCRDLSEQLGPGDVALCDLACPFEIETKDLRADLLIVPRNILGILPGDHSLHCQVFRAERPAATLFGGQLQQIGQIVASTSAEGREELAEVAISSLRTLLRPLRSDREQFRFDRRDRSMLAQMSRFIEENIDIPKLGATDLCVHFNISRATVYRVFDAHGGVMSYIRNLRLDRALEQMRQSTGHRQSVKSLARQFGFSSADSFSRAFGERFGMRPFKLHRGESGAMADAHMHRAGIAAADCSVLERWLMEIGSTSPANDVTA